MEKAGIFIVYEGGVLVGHPTGHSQNFISIPKGIMDPGETHLDAMLRELKEETGYEIGDFDTDMVPEYVGSTVYPNGKTVLHSYYIVLNDRPRKEPVCASMIDGTDKPEVDRYKWMTFQQVMDFAHVAQKWAMLRIMNLLEIRQEKNTE
jgi:8-oxo-dGTP pyrophosphatase MutT (NUDIX family)